MSLGSTSPSTCANVDKSSWPGRLCTAGGVSCFDIQFFNDPRGRCGKLETEVYAFPASLMFAIIYIALDGNRILRMRRVLASLLKEHYCS